VYINYPTNIQRVFTTLSHYSYYSYTRQSMTTVTTYNGMTAAAYPSGSRVPIVGQVSLPTKTMVVCARAAPAVPLVRQNAVRDDVRDDDRDDELIRLEDMWGTLGSWWATEEVAEERSTSPLPMCTIALRESGLKYIAAQARAQRDMLVRQNAVRDEGVVAEDDDDFASKRVIEKEEDERAVHESLSAQSQSLWKVMHKPKLVTEHRKKMPEAVEFFERGEYWFCITRGTTPPSLVNDIKPNHRIVVESMSMMGKYGRLLKNARSLKEYRYGTITSEPILSEGGPCAYGSWYYITMDWDTTSQPVNVLHKSSPCKTFTRLKTVV
jgi:hypothetical protein